MGSDKRTTRDISEIVEGKQPKQTLRESIEYARSVVDTIREPLLVLDADLRVISANRSFYKTFQVEPEETEGKPIFELGNRQWDNPSLRELLEDILPKNTVFNDFEVDFEFPDIGRRVMLLNARRIYSKEKKTQRILLALEDVTERELNKLKDEFIGMVSHELRAPLTVIMGSLNTLLSEGIGLTERETRHLIQNAALEADTLSHILGNLLELSRIQAGRLTLHVELVKADIVAKNAIERVMDQCSTHKLSIDFPDGLPPINVDPLRLERILYNLLDNAVKYSPPGSEVRVSAVQERDCMTICVSDQGAGIPVADQAKIFGAFERLERPEINGVRGTGLGLLVCRRLVEAHGGNIWVKSTPGQGSSFFFTLPFTHRE